MTRPSHPQVRSFVELAALFNVSVAELRGSMSQGNAPKPTLIRRKCAYYDLAEFKRWWVNRG